MQRRLHLLHRWLGCALGGLVLAWLFSGVVMMYVGFPSLTTPERLAGVAPLPMEGWRVEPRQLRGILGWNGDPDRILLGEFLGRPVYRVRGPVQPFWRLVYADDGTAAEAVTGTQAVAVAMAFARRSGVRSSATPSVESIDMDQWTVSTPLDPYRPLYRVSLGDDAGTDYYVSSRTGEVVRDTRRTERAWNWVGAVTHWIYPTWLRRHVVLWRSVVRGIAVVALILPLTGLWLAVRRWRAWPALGRSWRSAHGILGAVFGVFLAMWLFSGFLSFRVVALFDDGEPTEGQRRHLEGVPGRQVASASSMAALVSGSGLAGTVVEAEQVLFDGESYRQFRERSGATALVPVDATPRRGRAAVTRLGEEEIASLIPGLMPGTPVARVEWVRAYDAHYYSRRPGEDARPLPVIRLRFADAESTWFHWDPASGRLLDRLTERARAYRWLFNGLHSWDWPWLAARRPAWDAVVLLLLAGSTAATIAGLRLGLRRMTSTPRLQN